MIQLLSKYKSYILSFLLMVGMILSVNIFAAEPSRTLGFQGQFYTYNTPGNAPVNATFTFYDSLTGGNVTGTPISKIIQVVNGYFGTTFSESDTTGVDLNQQLYLEVSINGTTLSPRTTVNPTASSLKSFGTFSYAVAPSVGPSGSLYFNTTSGELYVSNGSSWQLSGLASSTTQWVANGTSLNYMAGNVGIGTTTPESKLTVMGGATAYGTLSSIGTASSSAQLLLSDDVNGYGGIDIYTYGGGALSSPHSYVNLIGSRGTSEAVSRVLSGDDIGMLNFYGQADSGLELAAAIGAVAVSDFTGSSAATDLFFITNKSERMRITSSGNVGIGTSSPSELLVVGSDLGEVTTGTGLVVGATSGVAGLNIGKDSTNRAWINWDVSNELVSMGTYASSTVNTNTLVLKDGKVGIGTTTPGVPLDVSWVKNGPTVGNSWVRVMRQASNRDAAFQIQTASGVSSSSPQWNIGVPNSTNNFAIYSWDGTTISRRLTIDTTGDVGIGTSTPSQKLDVWGNFQVGTSSLPALYVDSGTSRIGIGTTTPGRSLVVAGVGMQIYRTGGAVPHLEIIQGAAGTDLKNWRLNGETDGSFTIYPMTDTNSNLRPLRYTHDGRLVITTAGGSAVDSRLIVDSGNVASTSAVFLSGNVGIGTSSPEVKLHIVGTTEQLRLGYNSSNYVPFTVNSSGSLSIIPVGTVPFIMIGAATTPESELSLTGAMSFSSKVGSSTFMTGSNAKIYSTAAGGTYPFNQNNNLVIQPRTTGGSFDLIFATFDGSSVDSRMVVKANGNVGIGTTTPIQKFEVVGDAVNNITGTGGQFFIRSASDAAHHLNLGFNSTENFGFIESVQQNVVFKNLVLQPTGGNVGIGTTTPITKFQVGSGSSNPGGGIAMFGSAASGTAVTLLSLVNSAASAVGNKADLSFNLANNYAPTAKIGAVLTGVFSTDIVFSTFGSSLSEKMRIISTGNLGIGTTTPSQILVASGTIQSTALLGGATTLSTDANGNIIRTPSDQKLKTNVETLTSALDKVNAMRGVSYSWIDTERFGKDKEIGFIAQELETIVPEVVKSGGEYKSVNYQNLTALLTEAIKELSAKFDGLSKKVETEELCMKRKNGTQVCIDAEQLDQLLMEKASRNSVQQTPPQTPAPVEEAEVAEEPAPTPTPEPVAPPAEEPAPVASPTE